MNKKLTTLTSNYDFRNHLQCAVAQAVSSSLALHLPCDLGTATLILQMHGINFRVDFKRGGADSVASRVNLTTNGKAAVTAIHCG